jgi:hypothetical protein
VGDDLEEALRIAWGAAKGAFIGLWFGFAGGAVITRHPVGAGVGALIGAVIGAVIGGIGAWKRWW